MREKKKNRIEILGIAMLVLLISGVCMIPCFKTGLPAGSYAQGGEYPQSAKVRARIPCIYISDYVGRVWLRYGNILP